MAGPIRISILANSSNAVAGLDRTGRAADGLGSKFRGAAKAAARYGAAAAGLGAAAAVVGLGKLAEGAVADEKAAALLARTLKNTTGATKRQVGAVEAYISKVGAATGVTDDELRPALSKLATATGSISKSQKLANLAMDVSAGTGKSLEQVTTALAKAQNGSVAGLGRLGIATKNADGSTKSLAQVTGDLATKFKGQAATAADTAAGKYERMKTRLSEAGEAIGYKLIPPLTRFANFMLDKGLPAAERFAGVAKDKLGDAISFVAGLFDDSSTKAGGLSTTMDDLRGIVDKAKRAWEGLAPLIEAAAREYLPLVIDNVKRTIKAIDAMADAAIFLYNNAIGPSLKSSTGAFSKLLEGVGKTLALLGSIPGAPPWIKKTAEDALKAAQSLDDISDSIKRIPDRKDVAVVVTYSYKGLKNAGGPTRGRDDELGGGPTQRRGAGAAGASVAESYMTGLLAGIDTGSAGVETALGRVTDLIETTLSGRLASAQKIINTQIRDLAKKARKQLDGKAEEKALDRLDKRRDLSTKLATQATDQAKKAVAASLQLQIDLLKSAAATYDAINEKLDDAKQKLTDVVQLQTDYAASVRDSVVASGNVTTLGRSATSIVATLKKKLAAAQTYSATIQALTAANLNQTTLRQLVDAGVEGGAATAKAILAGGPEAITAINDLTGQLVAAGTSLGESVGDTLYSGLVAAAQRGVDGLASQAATAAAQAYAIGQQIAAGLAAGLAATQPAETAAEKLANGVTKKVKKKLKIKSPSRVFRDIGTDTVRGLALGLDDIYVKRQGARLAGSLQSGFSTSALDTYRAQRAASAAPAREPAMAGSSGPSVPLIGSVYQQPGESTDQFAERLWFKLRSRG